MRRFTRRFYVAVYFPGGLGVEYSSALTWEQTQGYVQAARGRARSIPGMVVRVIPLMGGES